MQDWRVPRRRNADAVDLEISLGCWRQNGSFEASMPIPLIRFPSLTLIRNWCSTLSLRREFSKIKYIKQPWRPKAVANRGSGFGMQRFTRSGSEPGTCDRGSRWQPNVENEIRI